MPTSVDVKNLKINKLTEAQYDTAVQGGVIDENELSVLTDVDYATIDIPSTMPELTVAGWSLDSGTNKYTQSVSVTGVTGTNTVFVSPAPSSAADYASSSVLCISQTTDSLTFQADSVPSNAITVNVVIMG